VIREVAFEAVLLLLSALEERKKNAQKKVSSRFLFFVHLP